MSVGFYDPPVINIFHQADPAAHVFKFDPDTVFIYGSHDYNSTTASDDVGSQYDMKDYYVLTQTDISQPATVGNKILDLPDVPWAQKQLWAPDVAEKDGQYYLFFPAKDKSEDGLFRIGVALSDTPDGTFKAEPDYIEGSYSIDPAVLADDDGSYYIYFGGLWGGQLQAWTNNTYDSSQLGPNAPTTGNALGPRYAKLSEDLKSFDGEVQELVFIDQDGQQMQANSTRRFFEASSINKIGDLYYYQYSTGDSHTIEVAVGTSPQGPFVWNSTLLQPVAGWTTHESITKFKDDWLLYYADASLTHQDNLRNTKVRKLVYEDGTLSLTQPQPLQPVAKIKRTMRWAA
ncbi:MAG: hypothetical protein Q9157_007738 [Trypethelium eluteriae]